MIGLDTNILVRAITGDDPVQSPLARSFIDSLTSENQAAINSVVLAEVAWTLRRSYRRKPQDVLAAIESVLSSPAYVVTDREAVNFAISYARDLGLEFADALIVSLNRVAGCNLTLTFDSEAARRSSEQLFALLDNEAST